jgi:TatD DNase family protein
MPIRYVDAHCHIQFDQYAPDQKEVIERMKNESVAGIVVGIDLDSSKEAVALAGNYEHLYASVGLHPNYIAKESFDKAEFRVLAINPKVVAIGECGLDFYRPALLDEEVKRAQRETLNAHIALAAEIDKPLIIHSRPSKVTQDAYHDLIEILKESKIKYPHCRGDIHFFVGGIEQAKQLIALDFTISFTAVITFSRDYDEVIKAVPLASILCETDSPYLAPASRRGQRNDPLSVIDIVSKIAQIRNEDPEVVRQALLDNTRRLFALPMTS